jgi:drug/metabolite transporter (DMT)-like permease
VRSLIGAFVLLPCIKILDNVNKKNEEPTEAGEAPHRSDKTLYIGGLCCGICLFVASNLQQFGIQTVSAGKAGFITAMYIVMVPVLGIFQKKKTGFKIWFAVALAVIGLYMLCMTGDAASVEKGDVLIGLCAIVFSVHILVIDHFSPMVDGVKMSCIQFFVCGILSVICMFIFEEPHIADIMAAWVPILYAGAMSCGVAYTLQIIGQKGMNPTVASLILSLESVVSLISGWIILGQAMSARELFGCVIMLVAIVIVQLPDRK